MTEKAKPGRGKIYTSITDIIGNTPLCRSTHLAKDAQCDVLMKLEFFNPLSSVKDRIGLAMIEAMEAEGLLDENSIIIEPTSGNTGIALAFVCAARRYRLILCIPESMSKERIKMLTLLGADLELTPASEGMKGAIAKAHSLAESLPGAVMPQQFDNPANPQIHRTTTAEEIWHDTNGKVDIVISGVGTGGTITGIGTALKEKNPDIQMIAVEPQDSPVLSGGEPGSHKIQGIGAGFIPSILQTDVIDEVITISNETSFETARKLARLEGVPCGISSGAAMAAALKVADRESSKGKTMVVILPSMAERYLSTDLFTGLSDES